MKKLLCFLCLLYISVPCIYAKKIPDPLYLNSDVIDIDQERQKLEEKKAKKEQKRLAKEQKKREKEKNSSKPKRIRNYQQIDKSSIPVTMEDYYNLSAEKLRKNIEIPEPEFNQDSDYNMPEPQYRVISYNSPPGQRNIDLTKVVSQRVVSSPAILSPDKKKMVYTRSFYYPQTTQTASAAYFIPVKGTFNDAYDILFRTNIVEGSPESIFEVGMDFMEKSKFTTLFPLDFSKDSNKIAFKEKIGSNFAQTWVTNIVVYDFKTKEIKRLTAVREAIIYYWRQKQIELKDYMWDIYPVGWDKNNPDRIIVYAYVNTQTNEKPKFLGTWSIDFEENKTELISPNSTNANIDLNGYGLIEIKMQH